MDDNELALGKMFLSKVAGLTALRHMPYLVFQVTPPFEAAENKFQTKLLVASVIHCVQCFSHVI